MSTTTPNAGYIKPDPDGSIGTWDTELNATIDLVDAHDHSAGKGVLVPTAGLGINADLPLNGFGLVNMKVADFAAVLASGVTSYVTSLFVDAADNELYWRTAGGSNVKITSGTSLNAALLGGFTGDYGTGGSEANFNSGTSIYNFLRAANHRAFLDTSDIRLFQGTAGITNAVRIRSPNALAASYDFVFPTALPAVKGDLRIGTTGQVEVVSSYQLVIPAAAADHDSPALFQANFGFAGNQVWSSITGATTAILFPIILRAGDRITAIEVFGREGSGGIETFGAQLFGVTGTALASITARKDSPATGAFSSVSFTTADAGLAPSGLTVLTTQSLHLKCFLVLSSVADEVQVRYVLVTYDRP